MQEGQDRSNNRNPFPTKKCHTALHKNASTSSEQLSFSCNISKILVLWREDLSQSIRCPVMDMLALTAPHFSLCLSIGLFFSIIQLTPLFTPRSPFLFSDPYMTLVFF